MALVQLDIRFELTEDGMMIIKELCDALAPIKVAVEALPGRMQTFFGQKK